MRLPYCLLTLAAGLVTAPIAVPQETPSTGAAPAFADEVPGYYAFYKRAGDRVRLDQEVVQDVRHEVDLSSAGAGVLLQAGKRRFAQVSAE